MVKTKTSRIDKKAKETPGTLICTGYFYMLHSVLSCVILTALSNRDPATGGGEHMEIVISFLVAVAAGVTCHLICKWLDSHNKDNEQPSGCSTTEVKREEPSHVLVVHTGVRSLFTWNIVISFLPTGIIAYADREINMLRLCKSVIFPPFVLKMSQNHISKSTRTSRNALKSTLSRLHGINILLSFLLRNNVL